MCKGLCAQIYLDLRYRWVCVHIFCFSFSEEKKYVKGKKQLVQDLIPPSSIYLHMCTLYTCANTHMPRFSPSGFFGPSRCLIPTPGITRKYPAVCACVCVYTHMHPIHSHPVWCKHRAGSRLPYALLCLDEIGRPTLLA